MLKRKYKETILQNITKIYELMKFKNQNKGFFVAVLHTL